MKITSLLAWPVICFVVLASHPLAAQTADDANKAKLEQRDRLWEQAFQVKDEGKLDDATTLLEQVYSIEESVFGLAHPKLLETLDKLLTVAELTRDDERVIEILTRQHRVSEHLYGDSDYRTQDVLRAIKYRKANGTRSRADLARLQIALSLSDEVVRLHNKGKSATAISLAKKATEIYSAVLGERHPHYATSIDNLATIYKSLGDYERSEPLYSRAIELRKAVLGEKHPQYASSLHGLASLYQSKGDYPRAERLYLQAIEIEKAVLGEQHSEYATSLHNLAGLYDSMGDSTRAEQLYLRAIEIQKLVLGERHPYYATSLHSLAELYRSMGAYPRAEPLYRQAIVIQKATLGERHPEYATSVSNLALLYDSMGDYPRAEPLYRKALEILKTTLGEQRPEYATCLNNLAALYHSMGDYPRAEPLYRQSMQIRETTLGEQHPDYANSLNNLASFYRSIGDLPRAEPLLQKAIEIQLSTLGELHPDYAASLSWLAYIYLSMGDYVRAEPLYRQAMEILKAKWGEQHPDYANSLNNLASLYHAMGDYSRAEPLYIQTLEIRRLVVGENHPSFATCLNNLASLYYSRNDYTRVEPLYRQVMEIRKSVLGDQHPDYAASLSNLASLYRAMGNYAEAEPLYRQAIEIFRGNFGEQHPDYATSVSNLAGLYQLMSDYPQAELLFRDAFRITLSNLELTADVQSQRQQVAMGESLRHRLDCYLSLASSEPKFQHAAYAALLRWKGIVWQRQVRQQSLIDQPSLQPRFEALQTVSSKLSTLVLRVPNPNERDAWRRQLDELTDEREKLERDLSLASVAFRQASTPVTPEQLRASLPERTMLLDFLEYWHSTPANLEQQTKSSRERRLLVHLVSADEEVRAIDLGDVASLNVLVQTWRRDLGQSPAAIDAARELRKRIWQPLEEHLGGITTVFVSPDGLLGQFPLAALPGKQPGSYLLEEMSIVMLPVPQGLPAMATTNAPSTESTSDRFCLVGGVDYEQVTAPDSPASPITPATPSGPLMLAARGGQWQAFGALLGTAAEIDTIESLMRTHRGSTQATILRGSMASEAAFIRNAPGNRYLHIATHGFFAPETVQNAMTASTESSDRMLADSESRAPKLVGQHPDLLSGLVFAGANHEPQPGTDDGILTAAEVQSLDLRGVDLAVLSACETGLGKTAGGEGIIGLQRAFQLAGARTTVTSLWKVDDAATQALMVEFYRNLFERKLGKLESLRQAQLWLLNNPDVIEGVDLTTRGSVRPINITADTKTTADNATRSLPAYWAAFQLSGDPR